MILADEAATMAAGGKLAGLLRAGDVVTMTGDLGAGKTTFVRGVLEALGHQGEVPSPTFAMVQPPPWGTSSGRPCATGSGRRTSSDARPGEPGAGREPLGQGAATDVADSVDAA